MVRYLVVTADDFGYCSERNRGIVTGYLAGGITRASLLVTAVAAQQAANLAALHSIPLGLHFNVTEGLPVSDKARVLSLLDKNGVFKGKDCFRDAVNNGHINLHEVKVELEAQLMLFQDLTGHLPLYVDGHNHIHVLHGVSCVFASVLRHAGVRSSRIPREVVLQSAAAWLRPPARMAFYKDVVGEAAAAASVFTQHGIRFSDGFVGMATMGPDMTVDRLERLLHQTYQTLTLKGATPTEQRNGTTPKEQRVLGVVKDTNCDKWTEVVEPTSYRPLCDEDPAPGPQRHHPDSGTPGVRTKTRQHGAHSQNIETETRGLEGEIEVRGRSGRDSRRATSSPCDTDRKGERPGRPHDNNPTYYTDSPPVVVELMVHPGYPCVDPGGGCGVGPDDFARSAERSHELGVLCSPEWRTVCNHVEVELCAQVPARQAG